MSEYVLEAVGIRKHFKSGEREITVLDGAAMELKAGGSVSIRGESGSGKTTLLNILSLLEYPDGGEVWWAGERVESRRAARLAAPRGRHFGMVFQAYYLIPELDVLDNVLIAARVVGSKADKGRARALLERVGLGERMKASPSTLSGGERQRVAVARALMNQPQVILADEPTGNLDERTGAAIMDLLLDVTHEQGTGLVLVTHNLAFAARTERQLRLADGKLWDAADAAKPGV